MAEGERKSQESISDLQQQLENYQNSLLTSESVAENLKNDLTLAVEKIKVLEEFLGPDRDFPLGVKISKGDDSDSSEISSDTACSSFVVIGEVEEGRESRVQNQSKGGGRGRVQNQGLGLGLDSKNIIGKVDITSDGIKTGRETEIGVNIDIGKNREMRDIFVQSEGEITNMTQEENDGKDSMAFDSINSTSGSGSDQDPLLSAQAALVSELQDRYKDSQNEVRMKI